MATLESLTPEQVTEAVSNVLEWVSLLEGGTVEQTRSVLKRVESRDRTGYCCLGAAAECVLEMKLVSDIKGAFGLSDADREYGVGHTLNSPAQLRLGLMSGSGDFRYVDPMFLEEVAEDPASEPWWNDEVLTDLNDDGNGEVAELLGLPASTDSLSFTDIARVIRAVPPGLFHEAVAEPLRANPDFYRPVKGLSQVSDWDRGAVSA